MGDDPPDDLPRMRCHLGVAAMLLRKAGQRHERLGGPKLVLEEREQRQSPRFEPPAWPDATSA